MFQPCFWIPGQAFGLPGMTATGERINRIRYQSSAPTLATRLQRREGRARAPRRVIGLGQT
jgi:hypothetical protein